MRIQSVTCASQTGKCFFIPKNNFIVGVLKHKLIDIVEREYLENVRRIDIRMQETASFQTNFLKMSKTMLSMEREKSNFLLMCEDYSKRQGDEQVRLAGDPITGIASDYADKIDYITSISGQTSSMKSLNKLKARVRESYYGLPVQTLEKLFGDTANGETIHTAQIVQEPTKEQTSMRDFVGASVG